MEQGDKENIPSISESQVNQSKQISQSLSSSSSAKKPLIVVSILICFILFGVGGYLLGIQRNSKLNEVTNNSIKPTISPTITLNPSVTPVPSKTSSGAIEILDEVISNYDSSYEFRKIESRIFEYQIDDSTKKIILGYAYEADISGGKNSIEVKIYKDFISRGFVEGIYNAAGPSHGAVRYGIEKGNIVCIIKTGYPYAATPDARILDVDCGYLEG